MAAQSATFVLLPFAARSAPAAGEEFPTSRRTRWSLSLAVPEITGTITVKLMAKALQGVWRELFSMDITTTGVHQRSTPNEDFVVNEFDQMIRGDITAVTGTYVVELTAKAPYLDVSPSSQDRMLLQPALREYSEVARIVEEAEEDVLNRPIMDRDGATGLLQGVLTNDPRFLSQVKLAIARQAERRYLIDQLRGSREKDTLDQLAEILPVTTEVDDLLEPFRVPVVEDEAKTEGWAAFIGR